MRAFGATLMIGWVAFAPAASAGSITQAEAEGFVRAFYHDMERDDLAKIMAHFDQTVKYYSFGEKDRAYVTEELRQYCSYYPSRSFSLGEIKLKPLSNADSVSVKFDLQFFIRSPDRDVIRSGRSHVEWDLTKRDGALKITRFDGSAAAEPAASPSR
jgi:hypothetical protein